jgi:hypothetical protein
MSLCQNENSCVACCGTLNLQLSNEALRHLLSERTAQCPGEGRADHASLVAYRHAREKIESSLKRYDESIYVCPFAGWIDTGRAGCLIHPVRTGRPDSQNASFYGASICQSYNCRLREKEKVRSFSLIEKSHAANEPEHPVTDWKKLALKIAAGDALIYSRIIGDALFYRLVEAIDDPSFVIRAGRDPLEALLILRLSQDCGPTSFELSMYSKPTVDLLIPVLFREEDRQKASGLAAEAIDAVERWKTMQPKRMHL